MRNLLALVGAAVVAFGGIGWYMGWYQIHVTKTLDGNLRVETDVDTQKVTQDSSTAVKQAGAFLNDKLNQAGQQAQAGQQPTPGTTPVPAAPAAEGPPIEAPPAPAAATPQQQEHGSKVWIFGRRTAPKGDQ